MKVSMKQLVAAILIAGAGSAAFAAPPASPVTIPSTATPNTTDNGSLILAVWDSVSERSIVQYLNLSISQIGVADMTVPGTTIDFGSVNLATLNGTIASSPANVQYAVFAADSDTNGGASPRNRNLYSTGAGFESATRNQIGNATLAVQKFFDLAFNSDDQCARANPCTTLADADSRYFGNGALYGSQLAAFDNTTTSISGLLGSALNFFKLSVPNAATGVSVTPYSSAGVFGQWLLDGSGHLTYTFGGGSTPDVPLPAAGWLLISSLTGLGLVGRRRKSAAATAAA